MTQIITKFITSYDLRLSYYTDPVRINIHNPSSFNSEIFFLLPTFLTCACCNAPMLNENHFIHCMMTLTSLCLRGFCPTWKSIAVQKYTLHLQGGHLREDGRASSSRGPTFVALQRWPLLFHLFLPLLTHLANGHKALQTGIFAVSLRISA